MSEEKKELGNLGTMISEAREKAGLSVKDLASNLNFSHTIIENLEKEKFSDLPAPMFVRGYIRSVSQHLSLDENALLSSYADHGFTDPSLTKHTLAEPIKRKSLNSRGLGTVLKWFGALLVASALVWFGFDKWQTYKDSKEPQDALLLESPSSSATSLPLNNASGQVSVAGLSVASPASSIALPSNTQSQVAPVVAQVEPEISEVAPVVAEPAPTPVIDSYMGIRLEVVADVWIKVTDSTGKVLVSRLLKQGSEEKISGTAPYRFIVGNSDNVKIFYKGQAYNYQQYSNNKKLAKFTLK